MRRRESGIAALTAILVVAVAASAAAMMLSQQSAMLDQTMLVASRAQAEQYAAAGLDWARGVLAQDARAPIEVDTLDEGWAKPIAGLPVERAVVAGVIADEQGKFNLNNLVKGTQRSEYDVAAFRTLLTSLGLSAELADPVVDWVSPNGSNAPYLALPRPYLAARGPIAQVDELYRVRGFDAKTVERLRPYVTALPIETLPNQPPPQRTKVNVNTAAEPVLVAMLGGASDKVRDILAVRAKQPFEKIRDFEEAARAAGIEPAADTFDVKSSWFSVLVRVQQDDVLLGTEALVSRAPRESGGVITIAWKRPRY